MNKKYEYKIVKIDTTAFLSKPKQEYHHIIHDNARDGWRLVQLFAPTSYGHALYYELIFEREIQ